MKHRKDGCKSRQQRDKKYPFSESTKLIELVEKRHYGDVMKLIERLRPYLADEGKGPFELTGLFFDLEAIKGQRQFIIGELALFLKRVKDANGLKFKQNVFFRYLSSPEHCNLSISENTLKARFLEAIPLLF